MSAILRAWEDSQVRDDRGNFTIGDTVCVYLKIIEGSKERIQMFQGTVIAKKGSGLSATFSVYRVSYGECIERVFPLHSPRITEIKVLKHAKVRRAKLYYLRGKQGKASKLKEKIIPKK